MRKALSVAVSTAGLLLAVLMAVSPLRAHHAFAAEYDAKKQVKLEGVVTQMEWINPHAWIHIDVTGPDGKVTSWMVEGGSPNILLRRGFTKNSLEKGQKISVDGFQAKDGSNRANGSNITYPDGKKLFLGSSGTGAPVESGAR
ncbi:MAG: hypothetical protein JWO19_2134 [Bryobacterales bacterium]|jgi:hypothetical protein|nr:hypothetical protein [Bryobacterales bacterium]